MFFNATKDAEFKEFGNGMTNREWPKYFPFFPLFGFSLFLRAFVVFASVFVVELHLYITDKLFVIRQ
jgi:hypothetical protein